VARIDELRQVTKIARLYYEVGLKQPEIATRLNLSQPRVSRLLRQALDEGIVMITVRAPTGTHPDLEERLAAAFGLRDSVVVEVGGDEGEDRIARELGSAAAYYLESTVRSGDVIGISSWSATLLAMVQAMHPVAAVRDTQVVQILGGVGDPAAAGHATHLIRQLAHLVHGEAAFLPAPGVVGSAEARRFLLEDPYVRDVIAMFDQVTVALVGIGAVEPSGLLAKSGNVFSAEERSAIAAAGGVGDLALRFVARDGTPLTSPLNDRVIGIELDQLRRVGRSVGVAGGPRKTAAIRGALRGGWINCLITDVRTAERLLAPSEAGGRA
jgi:DNA-binding transcriptional regulator LsrR (DeoR family)